MSEPWSGAPEPAFAPLTAPELARATARGLALVLVVLMTAAVFLPIRAAERLGRLGRPLTPRIASAAFAAILRVLGLRRIAAGRPEGAALVANHSSWLDIAALYAGGPLFFVSKAEVADWPVVGPMTRLCGTLYIDRRRGEAARHRDLLAERLRQGGRLAFFPEGTSSDGQRVLPFKTTLFAAFADPALRGTAIQPVGLRYVPPPGRAPEFHAWWGGMELAPHALRVLGAPRGGRVIVRYGAPVAAGPDRKALARELEAEVRRLAGRPLSPPSPPEAP